MIKYFWRLWYWRFWRVCKDYDDYPFTMLRWELWYRGHGTYTEVEKKLDRIGFLPANHYKDIKHDQETPTNH
jgi:hypothetical protein